MNTLTVVFLALAFSGWVIMCHQSPFNRHAAPGRLHRFLGPVTFVLVLLGIISFIHDLLIK